MGNLVPILCQEVIPGDRWDMNSEGMFRFVPMLTPIMHNVDITIHHFFVPNRIIWDRNRWEQFITGGAISQIDTPPAMPVFDTDTNPLPVAAGSLANYLGLPVNTIQNYDINALPFAAYQRIWYDWYRDENLQAPGDNPPVLLDGAQSPTVTAELTELRRRAWQHDYFTSCLPFAQKGNAVNIPMNITGKVNVYGTGTVPDSNQRFVWLSGSGTGSAQNLYVTSTAPGGTQGVMGDVNNDQLAFDPNGTLAADFDLPNSDNVAISATINDLRTAMALQKWLELNARAGSRYVEFILAHFNVRISDYRVDRAVYLGGSKSKMAISEVLQTSASTISGSDTPQGTMAGHGISITDGNRCTERFEEYGFIMSLLSVIPSTSYYQGIPKIFRKTTDRYAYAFPLLANIGEQPVRNEELVYKPDAGAANFDTFGYLPNYSEYRYIPSRVTGQMATSLDNWHLARKFNATGPTPIPFNSDFIECVPDKRIFAVTDPDEDEVLCHLYHKITCNRRLPYYGTPLGI